MTAARRTGVRHRPESGVMGGEGRMVWVVICAKSEHIPSRGPGAQE